ncbi:hypothetical protein [uncultured Serinicoccus sp.]|uniref:hypothetical protein n=1 Tax=uncultured Serinicoccus sp. TaxID=735514 RepID=UPI002620E991|nr:hypothetical protein [uncultured Serinicoccus sp.]
MSEERARDALRAEARRLRVLHAAIFAMLYLGYVGVQVWLLDRSVTEALTFGAVVVLGIGLVQYLVLGAAWVRHPDGPVERAQVLDVAQDARGGPAVVLGGGDGGVTVRVVLPRTTTGLAVGDTVLVSPGLGYGSAMGLVVPEHVDGVRPVLTVRGGAV